MKASQAVIFAGGFGTRLGKLAQDTPKPLLPVSGRPFIEHLLDQAASQGISDIIIACGHLASQFEQVYDDATWQGASVRCRTERSPAGTGGALALLQGELDDSFFALNGDSWLGASWQPLDDRLSTGDCDAVCALVDIADASRYGTVELASDGLIGSFAEKGKSGSGLINAGVYAMHKAVLDLANRAPLSLETDVLPALANRGRLAGVVCTGDFIDIGVPPDYERAQQMLMALKC